MASEANLHHRPDFMAFPNVHVHLGHLHLEAGTEKVLVGCLEHSNP
jgi:hypothetical protein